MKRFMYFFIFTLLILFVGVLKTEASKLKHVYLTDEQMSDVIHLAIPHLIFTNHETILYYEAFESLNKNDYSRAGDIEFRIYDENDEEIKATSGSPITGHYAFHKWTFHAEKHFEKPSNDTKTLTIIPYLMLPTDGGGVYYDEDKKSHPIKTDYPKLRNATFQPIKVYLQAE